MEHHVDRNSKTSKIAIASAIKNSKAGFLSINQYLAYNDHEGSCSMDSPIVDPEQQSQWLLAYGIGYRPQMKYQFIIWGTSYCCKCIPLCCHLETDLTVQHGASY